MTTVFERIGEIEWGNLPEDVKNAINLLEADMIRASKEIQDVHTALAASESRADHLRLVIADGEAKNLALVDILSATREALLRGRLSNDYIFEKWSSVVMEEIAALPDLASDIAHECYEMRQNLHTQEATRSIRNGTVTMHRVEDVDDESDDDEEAHEIPSSRFEFPAGVEDIAVEKALVAISIDSDECVILCSSGKIIEEHIEIKKTCDPYGIGLMGYGDDPNEADMWGIFIWEGRPIVDDKGINYSVCKWRHPTEDEWNSLANGEELWPSALETEEEDKAAEDVSDDDDDGASSNESTQT
jgi:hypothetical protein